MINKNAIIFYQKNMPEHPDLQSWTKLLRQNRKSILQ